MRFDSRVIRVALQPAWVALIIGATLLAALGGLWAGLQQDTCLLYTSPSPRDQRGSRMPSSA